MSKVRMQNFNANLIQKVYHVQKNNRNLSLFRLNQLCLTYWDLWKAHHIVCQVSQSFLDLLCNLRQGKVMTFCIVLPSIHIRQWAHICVQYGIKHKHGFLQDFNVWQLRKDDYLGGSGWPLPRLVSKNLL